MNQENLNLKSLDDVLTETDLIEFLGLKKSAVSEYRQKHGLPYCRISRTTHLYLVRDVLDFIASRRMVVGGGSQTGTNTGDKPA